MEINVTILWDKLKQNNDITARDELIVHYVPLVKKIAGRLFTNYNGRVEYDDLVSTGVFGLIDAIDRYDPTKENKFETYAQLRIQGAMVDDLRKLDWVPRSLRTKAKTLDKAIDEVMQLKGTEYKDIDVANKLGVSIEEYETLLKDSVIYNVNSFEDLISPDGKQPDFKANDPTPEDVLMDVVTKETLTKALELLNERERTIVALYFYEELTYKEIAEVLGLSEGRISQIISKIMVTLRVYMQKQFDIS